MLNIMIDSNKVKSDIQRWNDQLKKIVDNINRLKKELDASRSNAIKFQSFIEAGKHILAQSEAEPLPAELKGENVSDTAENPEVK